MQNYALKRVYEESGQALVLVLLSLSVVLTVVLFVLSRSVSDVSTSTEQSDSVRAFSAAEAGIEKALISGSGGSDVVGGANYNVTVAPALGGTEYNYPVVLMSGDTMTLWFVAHDAAGNMVCNADFPCFTGNTVDFCWGNPGTGRNTNKTPAIEVTVYYETTPDDLSTIKLARATFDPHNFDGVRDPDNSFTKPDDVTSPVACTVDGQDYAFESAINMTNLGVTAGSRLIYAKVRMIYNDDTGHNVGAITLSNLPSQGKDIISTGSYGTSETTQSNRRIQVFKSWEEFPFPGLAIFTPSGITK